MSIEEIVEEEEYTVEVSGTFHVFAESQEQANEYIEEQLYRNSGYVEQLSVYSSDYKEQN
jgi:predicted RNA-binding protein with PIN domain